MTRLFLVLVFVTGVALARPASAADPPGTAAAKPELQSVFDNPPPRPSLDFGTVVRDTSDEQAVLLGGSRMPLIPPQQARGNLPAWIWLFIRTRGSFLLVH
jgi:hypothetical protein